MKRLVLHIGLPKTATTYIQKWLMTNRRSLVKAGLWVPSRQILAHRFACEFISDKARRARCDVVNIDQTAYAVARDELVSAAANSALQTGILSSEYFYEADPEGLARFIGSLQFETTRIVIMLRRQDRLIESGYNQEVKAMGIAAPPPAAVYRPKLDWHLLVSKWSEHFGAENMRIINFDEVQQANRLLETFRVASEIPLDLEAVDVDRSDDSRNESLPANVLEFKRIVNGVGGLNVDDWVGAAVHAGVTGPAFRLNHETARNHLELYAQGNEAVARLLGLPADRRLFESGDLAGPTTGADFTHRLPIETVAQLLGFLAMQMTERCGELANRVEALEKMVKKPQ